MNIIVTGGLGHIGSALIRELGMKFINSNISIIDNLSTNRFAAYFNLPQYANYQLFPLDISNNDNVAQLEKIVNHADIIIHLAAITDAMSSANNKNLVINNNYNATKNISLLCAKYNIPLIYTSTTSVYGPNDTSVDESCSNSNLNPQSPYAECKLQEEKIITKYAQQYKFKYLIFRFGTIYGTSIGMRFHTAVNKFCWQAANNLPITVWKTALNQVRPYLSLDDAVNLICHVLDNKLFCNKIINIVSENKSVNFILEQIRDIIDTIEIIYVKSPIMNQLSYNVSSKNIKILNFKTTANLKNGILETLQLLNIKVLKSKGQHYSNFKKNTTSTKIS